MADIILLHNPMTTQDDIIVGGASGAAGRLAKGSDGQVLTVDPSTHHLVWATPTSGFADPMTTRGDMIVRNSSNVTARLPVGAANRVVASDGTDASWSQIGFGAILRHACVLYNSATQSLTNNTDTKLTFDTEVVDTDTFHSTVTNTSRITIPSGFGGLYLLITKVAFAGNGSGTTRAVAFCLNGTQITGGAVQNGPIGSGFMGIFASLIAVAAAGDYFEVNAYQDSGGNLNSGFATASASNYFAAYALSS